MLHTFRMFDKRYTAARELANFRAAFYPKSKPRGLGMGQTSYDDSEFSRIFVWFVPRSIGRLGSCVTIGAMQPTKYSGASSLQKNRLLGGGQGLIASTTVAPSRQIRHPFERIAPPPSLWPTRWCFEHSVRVSMQRFEPQAKPNTQH